MLNKDDKDVIRATVPHFTIKSIYDVWPRVGVVGFSPFSKRFFISGLGVLFFTVSGL